MVRLATSALTVGTVQAAEWLEYDSGSLEVTGDVSDWPFDDVFVIKVQKEFIQVGNRSGQILNGLVRGYGGSQVLRHSLGSDVSWALTGDDVAEELQVLRDYAEQKTVLSVSGAFPGADYDQTVRAPVLASPFAGWVKAVEYIPSADSVFSGSDGEAREYTLICGASTVASILVTGDDIGPPLLEALPIGFEIGIDSRVDAGCVLSLESAPADSTDYGGGAPADPGGLLVVHFETLSAIEESAYGASLEEETE